MSNWEIFLDGDNIPIEHYYNEITEKISNIIRPDNINDIIPNVFSQSNMVFKYTSMRDVTMRICCCNTTNKNATDAQIIFNVGKKHAQGKKIIIVSNDKIFNEIADNNIIVIQHNNNFENEKKPKLRKNNIINAINEIKDGNDSKDVYLCDLCSYFPNHQMSKLRYYINSLYDINISANDCVYIKQI